jgi:peptidoglycan/xylan/chitin deacetylase (PgdA/CDA1 family)
MAILALHNITNKFPLGITVYSPERFRRMINRLLNDGYEFVSLANYLNSPDNPRSVTLTFDDGYLSFYDIVFPILKEKSLPATVFIPFLYIGKTNSWDYGHFFRKVSHLNRDQIVEIAHSGITIGSHGLSHIDLSSLTSRLLRLELDRSKKGLENLTGKPVDYISYPFGRFDNKTEFAAIESGYLRGFSLSHLKKSRSGFSVPRYAIYNIDTFSSIRAKLQPGILNKIERLKAGIINSYAGGTVLLNKIRPNQLPEPH